MKAHLHPPSNLNQRDRRQPEALLKASGTPNPNQTLKPSAHLAFMLETGAEEKNKTHTHTHTPKKKTLSQAWWELPECKEAAKEAQREYLEKRGPLASLGAQGGGGSLYRFDRSPLF